MFEGLIDNVLDIVEREERIVRSRLSDGETMPKIAIFLAVDNADLKAKSAAWLRDRLGSNAVVSIEDGMRQSVTLYFLCCVG